MGLVYFLAGYVAQNWNTVLISLLIMYDKLKTLKSTYEINPDSLSSLALGGFSS